MLAKRLLGCFLLSLCFPQLCAATYYGGTFSTTLIGSEPPSLRGYQFMLNYDPERFQWRQFNVYFDGGFSHFTANSAYHSTVNICSVAPVIRYTFKRRGPFLPYLELSIGLAYLNRTRFEDRNLGIHFTFQDRIGIGAFLGKAERFTLGAHVLHYSNAHLSAHNSGITAPLVLDVGYRFQ